jgi:hypothetical protein
MFAQVPTDVGGEHLPSSAASALIPAVLRSQLMASSLMVSLKCLAI